MSKLITSFASVSGRHNSAPVPLDFSDGWNNGPIFDWYRALNTDQAKSVQTLEVRKDVSGPVPHRFIVLRMRNGQVHRFDRRPSHAPTANTNPVDLLRNQPVTCEDSYVLDCPEPSKTVCEIVLTLNGRVDILDVVSACYAISSGDSTRDYSFLRYNCFFFAWTILMVVSRRSTPHELPPPEDVYKRFVDDLDPVVDHIVNDSVTLFRDFVVDTLQMFRDKASDGLHCGMNAMDRFVWALPTGLLRFCWRQGFAAKVHLGLRKALTVKIKTVIKGMVQDVQRRALSDQSALDRIQDYLWVQDMSPLMQQVLRAEIRKVLWPAVLESISEGFGEIDEDKLNAELQATHLKFSLLGKNTAQLRMVWNTALHSGLKAVRDTVEEVKSLSNEAASDAAAAASAEATSAKAASDQIAEETTSSTAAPEKVTLFESAPSVVSFEEAVRKEHEFDVIAFDKAWNAAQAAARKAVETVVHNTRHAVNKPGRDEMWSRVWEIRSDCWDEARDVVQPQALKTVQKVVDNLLTLGVGSVTQEVRQSKTNIIDVQVPRVHQTKLTILDYGAQKMTILQLQEHMLKVMKGDIVTEDTFHQVTKSMGEVWAKSSEVLAKRLETIAEEVNAVHVVSAILVK